MTRLVDTGIRYGNFEDDRTYVNADRIVSVSLHAFRDDQWRVNVVTDAPQIQPVGPSALTTMDYVYQSFAEAQVFLWRLGVEGES